ncbi:HAD superfamily hydrolase [hydrothermal vent metagenome]|uniref:HAD superfamily hydrolase n=1 Tax=hydrothermal vent metagenome TaxID=652676 RepID=A0A3B1APG9_9ZZZZ
MLPPQEHGLLHFRGHFMQNHVPLNPPIKAIIFDVGNVLVRWDPRLAFEALFKSNPQELDYFLSKVCTLEWHNRHDQGVPFAENISLLQKKFPEYVHMIAAYNSQWDNMFGGIIEGSVQILHQLHNQKYPLFGLTNFPAEKFLTFKQAHDFMDLFLDIIVSGEEKITKPDPRIYQILLKRTGIPAAHSLFIDDRQENIIAAQKMGFQTHQFTSPENLRTYLTSHQIISL